jgi:hypothetical protein
MTSERVLITLLLWVLLDVCPPVEGFSMTSERVLIVL